MVAPPASGKREDDRGGWRRHLALATISFFICFTAWGLISGLASQLKPLFRLGSTDVALLIAIPVLLGALARLPLGIAFDLKSRR